MIPQGVPIYVATQPVDLRYGIERLIRAIPEPAHAGRNIDCVRTRGFVSANLASARIRRLRDGMGTYVREDR